MNALKKRSRRIHRVHPLNLKDMIRNITCVIAPKLPSVIFGMK